MLSRTTPESVANLERVGISHADAFTLRRIAMTLHRWHELECGDSNDYASWCLVRGAKRYTTTERPRRWVFEHDDNGKPWIETHPHNTAAASYTLIADREAGALRRLARVMMSYPHLSAYVQGDPRGASLYILRSGDVPEGEKAESYYSRGVAVYK